MVHISQRWTRLNQKRSTYFLLSGLRCSIFFLLLWFILTHAGEAYATIIAGIVALGNFAWCAIGGCLVAYAARHIDRDSGPRSHLKDLTPYEWFTISGWVLFDLGLGVYGFLRFLHPLP
jgi:hypothetical protein